MQLMNKMFGGSVSQKGVREDGQCLIEIKNSSPLFQ